MNEPTLEQRVAALERQVAALQKALRGVTSLPETSNPPTLTPEQRVVALERAIAELKQDPLVERAKWWDGPPLSPEMLRAHEEMTAYGRYFRKTGQEPPLSWKPGDPIPDPPEWSDER